MKKQKHHIHLPAIAIIGVLVVSFLVINTIKIVAQTISNDPPFTTCTTQCTEWSECSSSGTQTKTCKPAPDGCPGDTTTRSQSCTYVPPTCSYLYSSWSECASDGTQTRTVVSKSPDDCEGAPVTRRTCNYTPPAPTCTYTYTSWSECSSSGMQYRNIKSSSPAGCVEGTVEELKRSCTYVSDQSSSANDNTSDSGDSSADTENTNEDDNSTTATANTATNSTDNPALQSGSTETVVPVDTSWSVTAEWKKKYFGSNTCPETNCGGNADPDIDRLSNNDEVRYGTDPLNPDADGDGKLDGDEVASGSDPLKYSKTGKEDEIIFESPKKAGEIKADIYKVENVELTDLGEGKKGLKVSGKGPANSYVTVYIYSGNPIIVTVKTDSNGDWTYTIDKELEEGNHEVYVAVTNNSGAIQAKSKPLPFIKTAQAVTVAQTAQANSVQPTTKAGINAKNLLFILAFSFFGVVVAFILIGLAIKKIATKTKQQVDERIDK